MFPKRLVPDLLFEPKVEVVPKVEPLFDVVFPKLNVILKYSYLASMKLINCTLTVTVQFGQDFTRAQFSLKLIFYSCFRTHSDGVTTISFQIEI